MLESESSVEENYWIAASRRDKIARARARARFDLDSRKIVQSGYRPGDAAIRDGDGRESFTF